MIGEKIHNYKISRLIGEGGMASVYEAVHEKLQTKVAVKILNPMLAANKSIRQRFENEARFMASLTHPNITRVIDYEERPDLLAIIMEYLEGEDLGSRIKKTGAMPLDEVVKIFVQVLDAFYYAHQKGIVHRDVKPSNIFIEPNANVKILDFGIAKLVDSGEDMTMTGTQMGTPVYMSPEQVNTDKTIDHRSDIYSLGVTLYYLLRGEPPYDTTSTSSYQIYTKIVQEPLPDLAGFSEIDKIIKTATNKDRALRYQNCREFGSALREAYQQSYAPKQPVNKPGDADKTLIDIPEPVPVKSEPKVKEKNVRETPAPKRDKLPSNRQSDKKSPWKIITSVLFGLAVIIALIFKFYPSMLNPLLGTSDKQRAEAKLYLNKGKAEFKKDIEQQNYDTAVFYLKKAIKSDPRNQEGHYLLGYALYRLQAKDGVNITGLTYNNISKASDAFEKAIKIDPVYQGELVGHDPYSAINFIWGELALKYAATSKNDSALIAFREGSKRGGFREQFLEIARNTLANCDENALLFLSYDHIYHNIAYVQQIEGLRKDVKAIHTLFLESPWYFKYLKDVAGIPFSFGEKWFSLMLEKPWATQMVTIENAASGNKFSWWIYPENTDKLSVRSQVMLDILTTNKFIKPVNFSAFYDFQNRALNLRYYLQPEGIVYKLKTTPASDQDSQQLSILQNLNFQSLKKSSLPSPALRTVLDFIRYEYMQLAKRFNAKNDRASAKAALNSMEQNIPVSNYPFYFPEAENEYKSIVEMLEFSDEQRREIERSRIQEYLRKNNYSVAPTQSGLYYIETKAGSGTKPVPGKTYEVHYTGSVINTDLTLTKFDSSYDRNDPITFVLGSGQFIKGWEEGIAMMKIGSKGILIIPFDLGYGRAGAGNTVPPYATMVYEVELLGTYLK